MDWKDQEINRERFVEKPVGICKRCKKDVFNHGQNINCANCGEIKNSEIEPFYYPS